MNNPSHKKKKIKVDAPQWYIDACLDSLTVGVGFVMIRFNGKEYEAERIAPSEYLGVAGTLKWAHEKLKEQASSQSH